MKKVALIARLLLGLIYFVFGLNGFFQFLKMDHPAMSENAMAFVGGMMKSGYFMPFVSGTQVLGGAQNGERVIVGNTEIADGDKIQIAKS